MAYFVFRSKMESGYLCYYCNEKFDLFKDIFNHLIEKHNAETFILFLSVSHHVSTQDTNIISKTIAQGIVVYQHSQSRIWGGATGSDVIGSGPDRKWRHRKWRDRNWKSHNRKWSRAHVQPVPAFFSYCSSSTKCTIAHDRHGYRMWRDPLGRVRCAHVLPEVAQYPPYWGLFTGSDVIKRHVTPSGFPWKGMVRACATGSCAISDQTSPVGLPLENMGARMLDRKCPCGVILFVLKPNPKEDWNVLYHQQITSLEIEPIRLQEMNQPDPSFQKWTTNYSHLITDFS